ncbi:MAG TPA: hypothetical protein VLC28_04875, partial [Flavitalea sp.]|nr:hypothetical protein [Flavitalea sp.]
MINSQDHNSLQFRSPLQYSDSLNRISEISISTLDSVFTIALLPGYMNSQVPQKFRIACDKNQLEEAHRKCQQLKNKPGTYPAATISRYLHIACLFYLIFLECIS